MAYEVVRQLIARGTETVKGLVLLDAPPPTGEVLIPTPLIVQLLSATKEGRSISRELLHKEFERNIALMKDYRGLPLGGSIPSLFLRCAVGYAAPEAIEVHKWFTDRSDSEETVAGWRELLGDGMKILEVAGDHFEMFNLSRVSLISSWLISFAH